jgi:hypothetical protein
MDKEDARNVPYRRFQMHSHDEESAAQAAAEHAYNQDSSDTEIDQTYEMMLIDPDGTETPWCICHNKSVTHSATKDEKQVT